MSPTARRTTLSKRDQRKNTPDAFLSSARPAGRVIVCAGDSITAADMSSDWLQGLRRRFSARGWTFINAGINGNLAWNVLQRLDAVISCDPDAVVLFIGTNDVGATVNDATTSSMIKQQTLPQTPTLAWYSENVDAILARLTDETSAAIAVVEIPPLGEDPRSEINQRVGLYNEALRVAAAKHGAEVLPLSAALLAEIPKDHRPRPYSHAVAPMIRAALAHAVLRRSWDEISRRNGLVLLTDWVHLNDRAGSLVANLVAGFLEKTSTR